MKSGIQQILQERKEQIEKHGYSVSLDVKKYKDGQLVEAAFVLTASEFVNNRAIANLCPKGWNKKKWKKMCYKPFSARLVIAAAFIAAEIDRQQFINPQF